MNTFWLIAAGLIVIIAAALVFVLSAVVAQDTKGSLGYP